LVVVAQVLAVLLAVRLVKILFFPLLHQPAAVRAPTMAGLLQLVALAVAPLTPMQGHQEPLVKVMQGAAQVVLGMVGLAAAGLLLWAVTAIPQLVALVAPVHCQALPGLLTRVVAVAAHGLAEVVVQAALAAAEMVAPRVVRLLPALPLLAVAVALERMALQMELMAALVLSLFVILILILPQHQPQVLPPLLLPVDTAFINGLVPVQLRSKVIYGSLRKT
jgi:hypothetical protein